MDIYQLPEDQQLQLISMWLLFYFQFVEILFPLHGTYSQGVNLKKYSMQISRIGCSWFIRTKSFSGFITDFKSHWGAQFTIAVGSTELIVVVWKLLNTLTRPIN